MWNRVISYSLRKFEMFLKVLVIIIMRFGENNVFGTIYINFRGWLEGYMVHLPCFVFVYYSYKWQKYKSMTNTKIKCYIILILKKFLGWIIKILWIGDHGSPAKIFFGSEYIVVLTDIIEILLTPGIFLIQIFDANMY